MAQNKQLLLRKRPLGLPNKDTWELVETNIPQPKDGEILVQCDYVSLDPAMRGWINAGKSYIEPVELNDVMRAGGVGKIIESNHPDFNVGEYVYGQTGIQQYIVTDGKGWHKVDPTLAPLPMYLGTLGMPGMTAYFGILLPSTQIVPRTFRLPLLITSSLAKTTVFQLVRLWRWLLAVWKLGFC